MESILDLLPSDFQLEVVFKKYVRQFDNDRTFAEKLWEELKAAYSQKGRHYHNLSHLTHMLKETRLVLHELSNPASFLNSIFYHDIIYNVRKKDNEEKSANMGMQRACDIGLGIKGAELSRQQILATKSHATSEDMDTNYLTDIDLSILGATSGVYQNYTAAIRKEYSIYPGFLYRKGRKKVLKHFLEMDSIFKTDLFREKYEAQAFKNLKAELDLL